MIRSKFLLLVCFFLFDVVCLGFFSELAIFSSLAFGSTGEPWRITRSVLS